MSKNIVFLDIDGVLNYVTCKDMTPNGFTGIADSRVKILAEIVKQNDAEIVLVSSWKSEWDPDDKTKQGKDADYLEQKLAKEGLIIKDKTDDLGEDRGYGITRWLLTHEHKNWIVLDDEIFKDYKQYFIMPQMIRTGDGLNGGLQNKHIAMASRLFAKRDYNEYSRKCIYYLQEILDKHSVAAERYSIGKPASGKYCLIAKIDDTFDVFFDNEHKKENFAKHVKIEDACIDFLEKLDVGDTVEEFQNLVNPDGRTFKAGDIVYHFKHEQEPDKYIYQIVGVAINTETEEEMMVYKALYGDEKMFVRPLKMFLEEVDHEKYPEIKQKYRFEHWVR